jgi:hypothetical protein
MIWLGSVIAIVEVAQRNALSFVLFKGPLLCKTASRVLIACLLALRLVSRTFADNFSGL